MDLKALQETRLAATVTRYHSERMIREQSVGEHTYNVVCLIYYLTNGLPPAELVRFALLHDVPEFRLGDAPAPVKWNYKELKEEYKRAEQSIWEELGFSNKLIIGHQLLLQAADSFECAMYAIEEYHTGNTRMLSVATRAMYYLDEEIWPTYKNIWRNTMSEMRYVELHAYCNSRIPE